MSAIFARVGLVQRALPEYRVPFFDALARSCPKGLSIFAGKARIKEAVGEGVLETARFYPAMNIHVFGGPFYLYWQSGLVAWLEDWQPTVLIHAADPRCLSLPAACRWMHQRQRVVIGWGLGAPAGTGLRKKIRGIANRDLLRHFDAIITYSRRGAEEYRALGIEPGSIFIAPNAAAPRPTWPIPPRPPQFQNGQGVVLFVGRLQARKRVGNLLRACALLPCGLQPKVWIVGEGPERSSLEKLAADVYPGTEFFGDKRGLELRSFFEKADLLVLPGTGGLAIQQGMAFGLPVLVGEADGTQGDLVRPENGWQLSESSLEALTAGLETALSDPLRLRQMGRESFRIVENDINLENMVGAFAQAVQFFQGR